MEPWQAFWSNLPASLFGASTLIAALSWLAKTLIAHQFSKDLKRVDKRVTRGLARLNNRLSMQGLEHRVRFTKVFERQAEVVATTYTALRTLVRAVGSYIAAFEPGTDPPKNEKLMLVKKASDEFEALFYDNALYFDADVASKIETLHKELIEVTNNFSFAQRKEERGRGDPDVDYWADAQKAFEEKAKPVYKAIEDEFRQLLGTTRLPKAPPTK